MVGEDDNEDNEVMDTFELEVQNKESGVINTAPIEDNPCQECESVFSYKLPLKLHIKNNHTGKLKCDMCNFRTNTIKKIEEHEQNLHGLIDGEAVMEERTGLLAMVENIFDFGNQKKNQKKSKKKQDTTTEAEEDNSRFPCEDCDLDYARRDGLLKHRAAKH